MSPTVSREFEGCIPQMPPRSSPAWYALRVRSNFERSAHDWLQRHGFESFLPAYRSRRVWSDRVKWIERPLFPGYLFCSFISTDWSHVAAVPGLVDAVRTGPDLAAADEKEILDLRVTVNSGLELDVYPFLETGQRVAVRRGPLTGVEGRIVMLHSRSRIVVSIAILQRALAVELDASCVEPIH